MRTVHGNLVVAWWVIVDNVDNCPGCDSVDNVDNRSAHGLEINFHASLYCMQIQSTVFPFKINNLAIKLFCVDNDDPHLSC